MILLNNEDINTVIDEWAEIDDASSKTDVEIEAEKHHAIVKAQLKLVVEWRNEECTEHSHSMNISGIEHKMIVMHNDCEKCWQALSEEVSL